MSFFLIKRIYYQTLKITNKYYITYFFSYTRIFYDTFIYLCIKYEIELKLIRGESNCNIYVGN